ncbi:hypothetical protein CRENBAI_012314 [Crenichthys baileyi]|uniref:Uncharacterized protein n=1 Tax=Crenichthys baileyi TaxID=28760 RepID=A0AAV9SMD7_9TELE
MTPSCVSTPTNQRQVCIPPQPITFQGFAFKDLQPWISLLSCRASTLQLPYYRASTPSPDRVPGAAYLVETPDFPFPTHLLQLLQGEPKAFPGLLRDIVPPASTIEWMHIVT